MSYRGQVSKVTLLSNGLHVIEFSNCTLIDGALGENVSPTVQFLTVLPENDVYQNNMGKFYDFTISTVAVEDAPEA